MSRLTHFLSRRGLRAKILAAPVIALAVMVGMGLFTADRLSRSASLATSMASRTNEVEVLRDSNSRQFESDRQMYLALDATEAADVKAAVEEAHVTIGEAIDGYREFARSALTPQLRRLGEGQAQIMLQIRAAREPVLRAATAGRTATAAQLQAVEDKVDTADEANDALVTAEQKVVDGIDRDSRDSAAAAKRLVLMLVILALLAASAVAAHAVRGIMRGIREVLHAAEGIAEGDLDQHVVVHSQDEIGQMASAFGRMIEYLKGSAAIATRVADGDLTVTVEPRSSRDVLGNAFVQMVGQLRELAAMLSGSAQSLSAASKQMATTSGEAGRAVNEIAAAVGEVAQGAERQVRAVEQAKLATESVASASDESARNAHETAQAALAARDVAEQGAGAVAQASDAMVAVRDNSREATRAIRDLGAKSKQIGGIVETITGIAEQTNLLALNAAIEAARAGEQGRGFAVVAEEVRKLAEDSQTAAGTISRLVAEIQDETARTVAVVEDGARQTEEGVATVEQAREAFLTLGASVQDMNDRVERIAEAIERIASSSQQVQSDMGEVAAVAEQSSASSEEVSASTHETSASTQQIAAAANELASTADDLQRLVGQFTLA